MGYQNYNGLILHELGSSLLDNSMARIRSGQEHIARPEETIVLLGILL